MIERIKSNGKNILLCLILILFFTYITLLIPGTKMGFENVVFDKYGTSRSFWLWWKSISEITLILFLTTMIIIPTTIAGVGRKFKNTRKMLWASLIISSIDVLWLIGLTIAEKNEIVMTFFLKIFYSVHQIQYNEKIDVVAMINKLDFFEKRIPVLCIIFVLLIFFIALMMGRNTLQEIQEFSCAKIGIYTLTVGMIICFFNKCTESNMLLNLLGIDISNKYILETIEGVIGIKSNASLFFSIPILFIIITAIAILVNNKFSSLKIFFIGACAMFANSVVVICLLWYQVEEIAKDYAAENILYYSSSAKKIIMTESIGLYIFEMISLFMLLRMLDQKCTFLNAMFVNLLTVILGILFMRLSGGVVKFGIAISIACLISIVLFLIIEVNPFEKKQRINK